MIKTKNKKANIAVTLLVLMTVVLAGAILFIFYDNLKGIGIKITDSRYIDKIYVQENNIDFYTDLLMGQAIIGIDKEGDVETQFIDNFKKELDKYKDEKGEYLIEEFKKIEIFIKDKYVEVDESNKISLSMDARLSSDFKNRIYSSYSYSRIFEKTIV